MSDSSRRMSVMHGSHSTKQSSTKNVPLKEVIQSASVGVQPFFSRARKHTRTSLSSAYHPYESANPPCLPESHR